MKIEGQAEGVRPPIIVVMGHVDHGKSTLLDYIRKSNIALKEVGGITQKLGAYEVIHNHNGTNKKITFLDTPGHEAFQGIRARGAKIADIAILVVSAEDGVKPQTLQALKTILDNKIPYIVAINKIDKQGADIDRTKQSLAENEIYVEGYGGNIPVVNISAKTGEGVDELLEMILLVADMESFKGEAKGSLEGIIIETQVDKKKGNSATLIIKNGTIESGNYLIAGQSLSPVRIFEDFLGKPIKTASPSSPVRIIGWDTLPDVGSVVSQVENKKEAEKIVLERKNKEFEDNKKNNKSSRSVNLASLDSEEKINEVPVILKANDMGGLEALVHEIKKIKHEGVKVKILSKNIGDVSENDIKTSAGAAGSIILGFGVGIDSLAKSVALNLKTQIELFDIIYKLTERLDEIMRERIPKKLVEKSTGRAKILKTFSKNKDKQILGGKVENGSVNVGARVKIIRRDNTIGEGEIRELQKMKERAKEVIEGNEFGAMIESKNEIMPGDRIECIITVEE